MKPLVFPWFEIGDRQVGNRRPGDEDGLCQLRLSLYGQPETRHIVQVAWHEGHEHGVWIRIRIGMRAHPLGVQDLVGDDELHSRVAAPNRFSVEIGVPAQDPRPFPVETRPAKPENVRALGVAFFIGRP